MKHYILVKQHCDAASRAINIDNDGLDGLHQVLPGRSRPANSWCPWGRWKCCLHSSPAGQVRTRQMNFQKKYNLNPRSIDLKKSFCQILTMLAVFDTFFVISAIIAFSLPLISDYWNMVTNNFLICTIFSSLLLPR